MQSGVLVVDKPAGPTSFRVVDDVRRWLARAAGLSARSLKVGHGGTLDPMATGVLPVCLGEATKLAPFLLDADKAYEATLLLGSATDTLDAEGQVVETTPVPPLDVAEIEAALGRFRGTIDQVPPMYSALKRAGKPLHAYARAGQEVDRSSRQVTVFAFDLVRYLPPAELSLRVTCSKGTYVRVLGADLAKALGTVGHLTALRRTKSGPFDLASALTLDDVEARLERGEGLPLIDLARALAHLPAVTADAALGRELLQGRPVAPGRLGLERDVGLHRVLDGGGRLVAVVEPVLGPAGPTLRTHRVFRVGFLTASG